jgi:tetratricopeptide (TPR) repeat protein
LKIKALIIISLCLSAVIVYSQEAPDALELYNSKQYEEAVKVCLSEIEEMPRNMDSYVVLGWSLLALGKYDDAKEYSGKALTMNRWDYRVIRNMGESLYFLGENRTALDYFEKYISIVPTGQSIAKIYYFMGEIYIRLGEYNNADIAISTALFHDENEARWWSRLGYAREMNEDYDYAIVAYEEALKYDPNLRDAARGIESVQRKQSGE